MWNAYYVKKIFSPLMYLFVYVSQQVTLKFFMKKDKLIMFKLPIESLITIKCYVSKSLNSTMYKYSSVLNDT